ncbi:MAG: hypothetical protein KKF67_02035 [Nanoarchaeota archaeon]|nr:hypothetical protein [Nanoarchaeota archaeon]
MNKNKAGISTIIATVILIGLVIVAIGIIWVSIRGVIIKQIESTELCFGNYDKVNLNSLYTCYDVSSDSMRISLSIGDIEVNKVLISISGTGTTKNFGISNNASLIGGVTNYPSGTASIQLPGKNSGLTYVYDLSTGGFIGKPDKIEITPVIEDQQCEISDSLLAIENC